MNCKLTIVELIKNTQIIDNTIIDNSSFYLSDFVHNSNNSLNRNLIAITV